MPTEPKLVRYHMHGDVLEDGKRFYDARADAYVPLEKVGEITALDIERFKVQKRLLPKTLRKGPRRGERYFRPDDARNVFVDHPLMKVHPSTLGKAIRAARKARPPFRTDT